MRTKGLLLEVKKDSVLIMTRDGSFRRVPRRGRVEVGEEYSYATSFPRAQLAVAAVLLLAFASLLVPLYAQTTTPSYYVSVDINPSLELTVSSAHRVVATEALNSEAGQVLTGLRLNGRKLDKALAALLQSALDKGLIPETNPVLLVTGTPLAAGAGDEIIGLKEIVNKATARHEPQQALAVAVITAGEAARSEARRMGLSLGRYAVYLDAQVEGLPLEASHLRDAGLNNVLVALNVNPTELLQRVERDQDLTAKAERVREIRIAKSNIIENESETENVPDNPVEETVPAPVKPVRPQTPPPAPAEPEEEEEPGGETVSPGEGTQVAEAEPEPEEPEIVVAEPDDIEPEFEEARRGFWEWFRDFINKP